VFGVVRLARLRFTSAWQPSPNQTGLPSRSPAGRRLEARAGIEPADRGFADLGLTTWLPRPEQEVGTCRKKWRPQALIYASSASKVEKEEAMKPRRAALRSGFLGFMLQPICIESGLDIPTISRWLGHSDGGALAMRTTDTERRRTPGSRVRGMDSGCRVRKVRLFHLSSSSGP
jgi:hypothetical protein